MSEQDIRQGNSRRKKKQVPQADCGAIDMTSPEMLALTAKVMANRPLDRPVKIKPAGMAERPYQVAPRGVIKRPRRP